MTVPAKAAPRSNAYNIFILVLTILSLAIMLLLLLPVSQPTRDLLLGYDTVVSLIFLTDFGINLRRATSKRDYFFRQGGWLDLLGSIPNLGLTPFGGLLRLARLSRLARIMKLLRGDAEGALIKDVLANRGQYAAFITVLSAFIILVTASILVIQFEATHPDANITDGGDALWWAMVTITTVGYGDLFPVTTLGRLTAAALMFAGVGIIGALASILASLLVAPSSPEPDPVPEVAPAAGGEVESELAALRLEIAALRAAIEDRGGASGVQA